MTYPNDEQAPATFPVLEPYDRPVEPTYQVVEPPAVPVHAPEPQYAPQPAPAPAKKKTAVIALSIVAVLLFGTGAAFGILYSNEKTKNTTLTSQMSDKDKELADSAKKVQDGKDELKKAQDAQRRAEDAQKKAEGDVTLSTKCRDAARQFREAIIGDDNTKIDNAVRDLFIIC